MSNESLFQSAYLNFQRGQMEVAVAECQALLAADPRHLNGLQLLAHLRFVEGAFPEAADLLHRASTIQPGNAIILGNLGAVYCAAGQFTDAIPPLGEALRQDPNRFDIWKNLARALHAASRSSEAAVAYEHAIALKSADAETLNELAGVYSGLGRIDDAMRTLKQALKIKPQFPEALNNLAGAMQEARRVDKAIFLYRSSLAAQADHRVHANLIMALHLIDDQLASAQKEIATWNDVYAKPVERLAGGFQNDRDPDRQLRIGYVSRDFSVSPVGRFIAPILSHHDRESSEVFAYADNSADDRLTQSIRASVDQWRPIDGVSDEALARKIRDDGIDVLIDLGMHTKGSRLFTFTRKPAPVQLSYLAYAGTTGLAAMDGEISDPYLAPAGSAHVTSFWCYEAPAEAPPVEHHPGVITFGCLNNFFKVSAATRAVWIEILNRVPHSRLFVHALQGSHRAAFGVDPNRITFVDRLPPAEYFAMYNAIDIALDTFPYPGGTTTCDALWMGTPVITVAGDTPVSRAGLSICSNAGVPELVASSRAEYVELAVALANDRDRLRTYHQTLRPRMQQLPLMDATRAAQDIEGVYRNYWRRFCQRGSA